MDNKIKKCCYNCHIYKNDYSNCQGAFDGCDIEKDYCHEYIESLYHYDKITE